MHRGQQLPKLVSIARLVVFVTVVTTGLLSEAQVPDGEWHAFGRDEANTKYSPLDQITADNFGDLEIAWRWTSLSRAVVEENERIRPSAFKSSPLMANGLVYVSTALGQAAALDAGTGEPVWTYDPRIYDAMERPPNMGWHHRGLSYWKDDERRRAHLYGQSRPEAGGTERPDRRPVSRLRRERVRRPDPGLRTRDRRVADDLLVAGRHRG